MSLMSSWQRHPPLLWNLVPVVKLDMRIIFHGAAVACSLSLTNVNAVLAAAPGLVARRNRYTPGQIELARVCPRSDWRYAAPHSSEHQRRRWLWGSQCLHGVQVGAERRGQAQPALANEVSKCQVDFEKEVISELIYTSVAEVDIPC